MSHNPTSPRGNTVSPPRGSTVSPPRGTTTSSTRGGSIAERMAGMTISPPRQSTSQAQAQPEVVLPAPQPPSKIGQEDTVYTNSFNFKLLEGLKEAFIVQYGLSVQPPAVGKKLARIIQLGLDENYHKEANIVSDLAEVAWRFMKPPTGISGPPPRNYGAGVINVPYRAETEDTAPANAQQYRITLESKRVYCLSDLINQLQQGDVKMPPSEQQDIIRALNVFFTYRFKTSRLHTVVGGRKIFKKIEDGQENKVDFDGSGVEARRGFFTSVRLAKNNFLQLNLNVAHATFYSGGITVASLLDRIWRHRDRNVSWQQLELFIKGLRVTSMALQQGKGKIQARSVVGFASPRDTKNNKDPNRPRVSVPDGAIDNATPDKVKFYKQDTNSWVTV
ncbi:hypothetical protein F5Y17DRAFT_424987, partial [Xylariaceae sp. FL0594]